MPHIIASNWLQWTARRLTALIALTLIALAVCGLLASVSAAAVPGQRDGLGDQQRIDSLIAQLGDPSFIKREAARDELEKFGLLAFERLHMAEMHSNVEIAHSASYLLESMRVVWTLPTDSFDVQRLLKSYSDLEERQKVDVLQRLGKLHKADGYLALLRLMRYEKSEKISKVAGLFVMEAGVGSLSTDARDARYSKQTALSWDWPDVITAGTGDSSRTCAQWLRTLAAQLDSTDDAATLVATWQKQVSQERMLLESNAKDRTQVSTDDEIVKRLYRVAAKLMIARGHRAEALSFFEPCLDLVPKDSMDAFNDLQWMLEAGLPESVIALDRVRPELLSTRSRNRFLLAECYLKMGDNVQANKIAAEASELSKPSLELRNKSQSYRADKESIQRLTNFNHLLKRSLFDWAENELKTVLAEPSRSELSPAQELQTRQLLSNFYWTADQWQEAADAWAPALRRAGLIDDPAPEDVDQQWLAELKQHHVDDMSYLQYALSHYYFYRGLAAMKSGEIELARKHFTSALEVDASDPDLLIAMHRAAHPPGGSAKVDLQFESLVNEHITRLESKYRNSVTKAESELAAATSRNARQTFESIVAQECNQLAWLLAGTHRKPQDAVRFSQRSNTLSPDEAVFMDTLARCYFVNGQVSQAIDLQNRAVEMMPYERSMKRQLSEFQAAQQQPAPQIGK